jgi:transglutaminase-like putative cysteine protease
MTGHLLRASSFVTVLAITIGTAHLCQAQTTPPATAPGYALVTTSAKRVRGELTVVYRAPKLEADEWAVYAARLPELPGQVGARSAIAPRGIVARELSDEGRSILATRVVVADPRQRSELTVRVDYEATLLARKLTPLTSGKTAAKVAPLDPKDRRLALAPNHTFDFNAPSVREWLESHKLHRADGEGDVDLARRIFLEVKKGIPIAGDRVEHPASRTFEAGKTDGAGLVIAFVSALRAEGIPARLLAGRRAESSGVEPASKRPYDPLHIRAEFFAQGVGWVPADILFAATRDESPEGLRYFGIDEGDFVAFHVGTDFVLETFFGPKPAEWLQDPSFWVLGGGSFDGMTVRAIWKVKSEPVDPAETRKPAAKAPVRKSQNAPTARPKP